MAQGLFHPAQPRQTPRNSASVTLHPPVEQPDQQSHRRPPPQNENCWLAALSVVSGNASVLFTFYPPLTATPWFYIGLVFVVVASWVWCLIMIVAMREWKAANPGEAVPLAMFATVANAVMWLWTTVGVVAELLFQVIPAAFGWNAMVDVGLSRTLFSWTLHAIVYFWLFPSYIAFYTMFPRAAGGRLFSDTMGWLAFILFLLYSLPVGLHHLFMDPEHSNGLKFLQMFLTDQH